MPIHSVAIPRPPQGAPGALSATAVRKLVFRDIRTPLAALRASLESLARASGDGPQANLVANAVEQLLRVEQAAEVLCESAYPAPPTVTRCTLEEIVRSACQGLRARERERVVVATEDTRTTVELDTPLLARALARLLRGALADGASEVLLHSNVASEALNFSIVDDLDPDRHTELEGSFEPSSELAERADISIAVRDIRRMGGSVEFLATTRERTCVLVVIPIIWLRELVQ